MQTVVTSPPYWSLRDYAVEAQTGCNDTLEDYGFVIYPAQVPLLRQCIEEKSREPWERYIEDLLEDGRVY